MTSRQALYARKLSGVERYSMAINEIHRYNVDGLVFGCGRIDIDALRRAVTIAATANPGMRVRLKGVLGFAKWVDSGIAPQVSEVNAPQWSFYSEEGADFLRERFNPLAGGPVVDVVLVHGKDKTGVVFRNLHAAVDGRGVMHWMHEVFRALRGESLIGGESTLADFEVAEQFRDKLNTPAVGKHTAPAHLAVMPPSLPPDRELSYLWRTVCIPKRITTILPKAAVYLAAYARRQGEGAVAFTVPVDYRGLRADINSTGNLTGYLRIQVRPDDTPKNVMQQINQQIRDYADCHLPLAAKPLRWVPLRLIVNKMRKMRDAVLYQPNAELPTGGLVSMGHTKLEDYSTPDFHCEHAIGIPGAVGKLNIVAVNYTDSTYVTFSVPKNYNRDGQLDRLIAEFVTEFSQ